MKINQVKTLHDAAAIRVQDALGWDEQQYAEFQFEQAYEFLKYWIGEDVFGYKELPLTAIFWAWWRNQWYKRDMEFLCRVDNRPVEQMRYHYRLTHCPERISRTPGRVVMDDAYAKMIYELTHQEERV